MRLVMFCLLVLVCPVSVAAQDPVERSLSFLIESHRLEQRRPDALRACSAAAGAAAKFRQHELLAKFCMVRLGAPRIQALFLGEQLAHLLEQRGEHEVAAVIDQLLVGLEAR